MEDIRLPPFYVGQKVAAIKTHTMLVYKRNDVFYVRGIRQKPCCGGYQIDIGVPTKGGDGYCTGCNGVCFPCDGVAWWVDATNFVPVEDTFKKITFAKIIEQEKASVN